MQVIVDELTAQRQPGIMPPRPLVTAVKRALGLPVIALVRWPVGKKDWRYTMERIA